MSDNPNDKPQPDALRQQIEAVNAACDEARSDPVSAVRISFGEDAWLDLHADGNGRLYANAIQLPARPAGKLDTVKRRINQLGTRLLRLLGLSG